MSRLANALEGTSGKEGWSGVPYVRIDGDTDSRDRQTACLQFKEDAAIRVALLSITAAGASIHALTIHDFLVGKYTQLGCLRLGGPCRQQ